MLVDLGDAPSAKIVRALSSCVWMMNKEIVEQQRNADFVIKD